MDLARMTVPALIDTDLKASERHGILRALAELVVRHGDVQDAALLVKRLEQREALGSTGIGHGIAVPHCRMAGLDEVVLAIGISRTPIAFEAIDGAPARLFFLVISPEAKPAAHVQCLAAISGWLKGFAQVDELLTIRDPEALFRRLPGAGPPADC